jgi:hypothetical protein
MIRHLLALAILLAGLAAPDACAGVRKFPEHNFSLDLPEWWMAATPAPAEALAAFRSPKRDRSVYVTSTKNRQFETANDEEIYASAKQGFTEQKFTITGEGRQEAGGLTWLTITARGEQGLTSTLWLHRLGPRIYSMRADHLAGDVATDPEIQATLRSFRFLEDPAAPAKKASGPGAFWWPAGMVAALVLVGGTILIRALRHRPRRR